MKFAPAIYALTLCGYVSISLLFPVVLAIHKTSSSIHIDNGYTNQNGEVQETSLLDGVSNVQNVNDVTRDAREDRPVTYTASEKFLGSLREKCKKYKSISLICSSLRLVLPITPAQTPLSSMAPSEEPNPEDSDKKALPEDIKLQKRFTQPSHFTDIETHIIRPEQYDETTALPSGYLHDYYHNHKEASTITNQDRVHDVNQRQTHEDSGISHLLYNERYKDPSIFYNNVYENNMMVDKAENNPYRKFDTSEKNLYSEITQENLEHETNPQERGTSPNMTYQNQIPDISEDDVFRTTDRAKEIGSSEFVEEEDFRVPYTDINPDYDEREESEQSTNYETEKEDNNDHVNEDKYRMECKDRENCSAGESNAENGSGDGGKEEDNGKSEMVDRFVDDSVKIFKNSLTIKFPTFERVTNKISEWFQSVFGTRSRDEARGKLKKTLGPIIIGLVVKGVIILVSVIGLVMKFVAAKAVILSVASIIFTAVVIFKKFNSHQGGTIFVHTNGGAAHKTGSSWDKEGYGQIYQPHRASKDVNGYQVWENYSKKHRGEYSTPTGLGDRYYQYYNSYYRPNSAIYTTTVSPY